MQQAVHSGSVEEQGGGGENRGESAFFYPAGRPLRLRGEQLSTDGPEYRSEEIPGLPHRCHYDPNRPRAFDVIASRELTPSRGC